MSHPSKSNQDSYNSRIVHSELVPRCGGVERRMMIHCALPGAVQVVGHHVQGVQVLGQGRHVVPSIDLALAG